MLSFSWFYDFITVRFLPLTHGVEIDSSFPDISPWRDYSCLFDLNKLAGGHPVYRALPSSNSRVTNCPFTDPGVAEGGEPIIYIILHPGYLLDTLPTPITNRYASLTPPAQIFPSSPRDTHKMCAACLRIWLYWKPHVPYSIEPFPSLEILCLRYYAYSLPQTIPYWTL